jgi:hypothetical protein
MGPRVKVRAKKNVRMHVSQGHATLRRAVKKLVTARVLNKQGKKAMAKRAATLGRKAMAKAVSHYTKAAHTKARIKTRFTARKRRGGGGGGGVLGTILGGLGGILGGI